jgi:hypothetical protein
MFSRIEGGLDSAFDRAAGAVFRGPIEPAQIAKRAEKQMNREKLVGAGRQYAPTLYTVLVNPKDNQKLFGFYPTMAAEIETYLLGKGTQNGLKFDGRPLVRFIVDETLKSGKFEVIAENVSAPIIAQLREEELEFYGLKEPSEPAGLDGEALDFDEPDALGAVGAGFAEAGVGAGGGIAGASAVLVPGVGVGAAGAAGIAGAVGLAGAAAGAAAGAGAAAAAAAGNAGYGENVRDSRKGRLTSIPTVGSPSTPTGQARLFDLNLGKAYPLTTATLVIGRDASCDIVLDDANISRRHAQLAQDAIGTWKLTDLNSTNGTRLNGQTVTNALLRDGDEINIGVTVLEFRNG